MSICLSNPVASDALNRLQDRWGLLCDEYLPLAAKNSIWRYSRKMETCDPSQGWKIHVSSTVITACDILSTICPALKACGALFKAPVSLDLLMRINSGIFYGYSQVGKIITVYPRNETEFVKIVGIVKPLLARWPSGPAVPFDLRHERTCIYYRYGAFRPQTGIGSGADGLQTIVTPDGIEIEDRRNIAADQIPGFRDPLTGTSRTIAGRKFNKLNDRYIVYRAISQRGKGGVYECLDVGCDPPMVRILKEGRKNGETSWDGRDGTSRIKNEELALLSLASKSINIPRVCDRFCIEDSEFLVLEHIDGVDLNTFLVSGRSRAASSILLDLCRQMCEIVASVHDTGWLWRDCKPGNFIIDMQGNVSAVDFEGACPIDRPDPLPWSTPLFMPPELSSSYPKNVRADRAHDLYALGVCLFHMLEGTPPPKSSAESDPTIRRGDIPKELKALILSLLSVEASQRPGAKKVSDLISEMLDRTSTRMV